MSLPAGSGRREDGRTDLAHRVTGLLQEGQHLVGGRLQGRIRRRRSSRGAVDYHPDLLVDGAVVGQSWATNAERQGLTEDLVEVAELAGRLVGLGRFVDRLAARVKL